MSSHKNSVPPQNILLFVAVSIGSLVFLAVNFLAYYYGWKKSGRKPNVVITTVQKMRSALEDQTGYTIMPVQNEVAPGRYACDPNGVCNAYADPASMGCPKTFRDPNCLGKCNDPKTHCTY